MNKSLEQYWRKRFQRFAQEYNKESSISSWSDHSLKRRVITFGRYHDFVDLKHNSLILDLGCGAGTYCKLLTKKGHSVIGIDYSFETLKKAKKIIDEEQVHLYQAEIYHLPFKDKTFDEVVCIGVFQYVAREKDAILEIARVLKNGGIFFLGTLNSLGLNELLTRIWNESLSILGLRNTTKESCWTYYRCYNPFKIAKTFRTLGFDKTRMGGIYILPQYLEFLETFFENFSFFQFMDSIPFLSFHFARAFLLMGTKNN